MIFLHLISLTLELKPTRYYLYYNINIPSVAMIIYLALSSYLQARLLSKFKRYNIYPHDHNSYLFYKQFVLFRQVF